MPGHTEAAPQPGVAWRACYAAHLLAAGAWLGGLAPLGFILLRYTTTSREARPVDINRVLLRFSDMGYVAVATLVGSGLINSWFLVGSVSSLLETPYGQVLLGKLAMFAGMLALAASNRFWLVPSMNKPRTDRSDRSTAWTGRLRNHVLGEQFLGLMILLAVSILGTMRPAAGQWMAVKPEKGAFEHMSEDMQARTDERLLLTQTCVRRRSG